MSDANVKELGSSSIQRLQVRPLTKVVFAASIVLIGVGAAPFFMDAYSVNVLVRSMIYAAMALSVDILWGYLGVLTFGQSAFFAAGAYATALVFTYGGFSPEYAFAAVLIGMAVAVALAGLVAFLAFWHGASALYASVITLVLPIVVTQLLFSGGTYTGSSSGLTGFDTIPLSTEAWFWAVGVWLVVLTTGAWMYTRSDAGRLLIAIRENEQRCKYLGLNTSKIKALVFLICAAIGAIAGWIYANYTMVVAPEIAGFTFGTELLIWVALGGRGTLFGPVIGTIIIDYASAHLQGDFPFVWKLVIGIVFVSVIVALPRGILPLVSNAANWLRGRTRKAQPEQYSQLQLCKAPRIERNIVVAGPALVVSGVEKRFGSLEVLSGIDFEATYGEIVSLVGPNGAGKTTLMTCIADGSKRSGGTISIGGQDIAHRPPEECVRLGVGRKFQMANVFDTLTVGECLQIARARLDPLSKWKKSGVCQLPPSALHVVRATGLHSDLDVPAQLLSHGKKQALELAMVLALEPKVILLDEPTAGLTKTERTLIGTILTELATTEQLCILLVEHDLDFVRDISSRVIVLHQGRIVLNGSVDEVVNSELVKTVYAGSGH
ncbi:ATP-binding cassette domain-containing protein [Mesorhizobium sp. CA8]|uniref:ABC transporter permease subunit n=1 Tax=unclassified Mesorhizobium TaxID=325217 RepID=UPI001CCC1730|nr:MULTISPECIES: ATP-binding cassette domain-containing protein [unclassified Mesorhizobium]MBZ9765032.1 ATP-binding cassette domain-containing protein [Mesorhizobium sp. CA8]MBZ9823515.1 ATP-binding cassette domain-containing protein [Mesorhizobium sp. CA4]